MIQHHQSRDKCGLGWTYEKTIGEDEVAKDWALSSVGATLGMSVVGGGAYTNEAYVHDGNDGTYSRAYSTSSVGSVTYIITFTCSKNLIEIKFYAKGITVGSPLSTLTEFSYYDGSWNQLALLTIANDPTWYTYDAGYTNVTKIKIYTPVTTGASSREIWVYTASANGEHDDSGIRNQKSDSIVSIACEPLIASHKLRFRKGDTTVGIPLVQTTDSQASPLRIYDGSSVKAVMKYS